MRATKDAVHDFWNKSSCGEELYLQGATREGYDSQLRTRYALEPEILDFAEFHRWQGRRVLEIGVGLGADHQMFAQAGALLNGIDLTERAIGHVRRRLEILGLRSELAVGDAEALPFADNTFDMVYSWGVLHHTPDTPKAIREVHRVLKPGGHARIMIYHKHSMVGYMLWMRYALLRGRPWTGLKEIYANHLESPGTQAFSIRKAREFMRAFADVRIESHLGHGDLLTSQAGVRHRGTLLSVARLLWPRWFIKTFLKRHGLFMCIWGRKPAGPA